MDDVVAVLKNGVTLGVGDTFPTLAQMEDRLTVFAEKDFKFVRGRSEKPDDNKAGRVKFQCARGMTYKNTKKDLANGGNTFYTIILLNLSYYV